MRESSAEVSPEAKLQHNIDQIKDSDSYSERYKDPKVQELLQALDLLTALRVDLSKGGSRIPWEKVRSAHKYLDQILKEHLDSH